MSQEFYSVLTIAGEAAFTNAALTATTVDIAEVAVGSGDPDTLPNKQEATALVNEEWRGAPTSVAVDPQNANRIVVTLIIPAATGGWNITEAGLIDGAGSLIMIARVPSTYKPLGTQGAISDMVVNFTAQVSDTELVTIQVDPNVTIASRQWVLDQFASLVPQSTETVVGKVELATVEETKAGTDNTRAIHPAGLKAVTDDLDLLITVVAWEALEANGMNSLSLGKILPITYTDTDAIDAGSINASHVPGSATVHNAPVITAVTIDGTATTQANGLTNTWRTPNIFKEQSIGGRSDLYLGVTDGTSPWWIARPWTGTEPTEIWEASKLEMDLGHYANNASGSYATVGNQWALAFSDPADTTKVYRASIHTDAGKIYLSDSAGNSHATPDTPFTYQAWHDLKLVVEKQPSSWNITTNRAFLDGVEILTANPGNVSDALSDNPDSNALDHLGIGWYHQHDGAAANNAYVDNWHVTRLNAPADGTALDMTLDTPAGYITADSAPNELRLMLRLDPATAPADTANIKLWGCRDGATFVGATFEQLWGASNHPVMIANLDLTLEPTGTDVRARLTTTGNVGVTIHELALQADQQLLKA